jgi:anti-sigma regulatory factor (Ser/Thr protein kinase)
MPEEGAENRLPFRQPQRIMSLTFTDELSQVRGFAHRCGREAGLTEARVIDLVLAVSEVAANTWRHARSPGTLDIWYDADEIVCQVRDKGVISDPLVGTRQPPIDAMGGHGLWLVNQVCDQVEILSGADGTTVRLHMLLRPRLTVVRALPGDRPRGC